MMQCDAAVLNPMYGDPHRCSKKHRLSSVAVGGEKVQICPHHMAVLGRKGTLDLWKECAPLN